MQIICTWTFSSFLEIQFFIVVIFWAFSKQKSFAHDSNFIQFKFQLITEIALHRERKERIFYSK